MRRSFLISAVLMLLLACLFAGSAAAKAVPMDVRGRWVGQAVGADDFEYTTVKIVVDITDQNGAAFLGNAYFDGSETPNKISGIVHGDQMQIITRQGYFEGGVYKKGKKTNYSGIYKCFEGFEIDEWIGAFTLVRSGMGAPL